MKNTVKRRAPWLLLAAVLFFPLPVPVASARVVDGVVATVDGEPVTLSELRDSISEALGVPPGDADAYLREERDPARILRWIEPLVESILVRKELERTGQPVTEAEIDRVVESVRRSNNLSEADFVQALSREGLTLANYRRKLRWQLERGAVVRARKLREVTVTEEESKKYYEANAERFREGGEVRLEVLLFPVPPGGGSSGEGILHARVAAQQAAELVRAGRPFPEVAERVSAAHPGTRRLDTGLEKEEDLAPEVRREVRKLLTGVPSAPFLTESGIQIVAVRERRGGTLPPYAALREALAEELASHRSEKAYADILSELKGTAAVDVRL